METMSSVLALHPNYSETDSKFVHDFWLKLKLMEEDKVDRQPLAQNDTALQNHQDEKPEQIGAVIDDHETESEQQDGEDEEEFSFSSAFGEESLISAEEAFLNGQIRPIFPLFDRDLLLSDETDPHPEGPYCEWSASPAVVVDASPEVCKKSNSTGFCKLRRFRELVLRSNSDGKDKFAFMNESSSGSGSGKGKKKTEKVTPGKKKKETASSAFEKIYARRKKEEAGGKRVSYLPYKQVGFFASVNGLSKNLHPY
ncbi:hypothetical protein LINGRAHAP2_LOCUS17870 [Linum grandiflorum]